MPPKTPRPPLTHFLCLPLSTTSTRPILEKSLLQFRNTVLAQNEPFLVPELTEGAFRPVGTMHLTLGVMSLRDQGRISAACKFLEELDLERLFRRSTTVGHQEEEDNQGSSTTESEPKIIEPLKVSLRGIHAMHAPAKTSVLYTPPQDHSNRLLPFATRLKELFTEAEFILPETRPLKLHATVINTIYASPKRKGNSRGKGGGGGGGRHVRAAQIDATKIIEEFADFEFVEDVTLEKVAICKMGAVKSFDEAGKVVEEAYEEVASREMPR